MTAVSPRVPAAPAPRHRQPVRAGRADGRRTARAPRAVAAAAGVRRAVRDGRRAQRRRARDDPLGVVGRGALRLRLVVVLLQPPAHLGARRAGDVPRRVAHRLPALAPLRARTCSCSRSRRCRSCSSAGSWCRARSAGSCSVRCSCSRARSRSSRCSSAGPRSSPSAPIGSTTARVAARSSRSSCVFAALVMKEPDLASTIVLGVIVGALLIVGGVPRQAPRADDRHRGRSARACSRSLAGYRRARMFSFLHPGHDVGEHRLPALPVAHRDRQRRPERRRPRRGPRQVVLPPERAHRLHLRDHRRGARLHRLPARARAVRRPRARRAAHRAARARPLRHAASRPASPRGSSARPRSTSARSSGCCRSRASRCRSSRSVARRS